MPGLQGLRSSEMDVRIDNKRRQSVEKCYNTGGGVPIKTSVKARNMNSTATVPAMSCDPLDRLNKDLSSS